MVYLPCLVFDQEIDLIRPYVGIDNSGFAGLTRQATDGFERRRFSGASAANDAVEIRPKMDALTVEKSAGHPDASDEGHGNRNLVLNPNAWPASSRAMRRLSKLKAFILNLVTLRSPLALRPSACSVWASELRTRVSR
jgi:hypothetical protein